MKKIILIINIFFLLSVPIVAQQKSIYHPVDQPDADGRIIRGRDGTHHWQPYMKNADLSTYYQKQ